METWITSCCNRHRFPWYRNGMGKENKGKGQREMKKRPSLLFLSSFTCFPASMHVHSQSLRSNREESCFQMAGDHSCRKSLSLGDLPLNLKKI